MRRAAVGIVLLAGLAGPAAADDMHLPEGNAVTFTWNVSDGNGFHWDVQSNCCVGNGTRTGAGLAYDGCMLPMINGVRFDQGPSGGVLPCAWSRIRENPREIEGGGWTVGPLHITKRVHVPVDRAYCRFIDLYENRSEKEYAFTLRYRIDVFRPIGQVLTASGKDHVGKDDFAFLTGDAQGSGRTLTCHVLGSKGAPLRSKFVNAPLGRQIIEYDWGLSIPPGKTVALCLFESQQATLDEAKQFLREFDPTGNLQGVSSSLRRVIGNLRLAPAGAALPALPRDPTRDRVVLLDGNEFVGEILPGQVGIETAWGKIDLAGGQVTGMVRLEGDSAPLAVVLADGQVVVGRPGPSSLSVRLPSSGTLDVPLDRVRAWARHVEPRFPDLSEPNAPRLMLRSGDQLSFDPRPLQLVLHSDCGAIGLKPETVLEIESADANGSSFTVTFTDGSRLTGRLDPNRLELKLGLGSTIRLDTAQLAAMCFPEAPARNDGPCTLRLAGDDVLLGQWADASIALAPSGGPAAAGVDPRGVRSLSADANGQVRVVLWDESEVVGQLKQKELSFRLAAGISLKVPVERIRSLAQPGASAPAEVVQGIEKLVVQLGAKDFKDREAATRDLAAMSATILPLLRKHRGDPDPEVRTRLQTIIDILEARAGTSPLLGGPDE